MKPQIIPELEPVKKEHGDSNDITVLGFEGAFHVPLARSNHLYFSPYLTKEEAIDKNRVIKTGIPFKDKGYYIALPVGTKAETICWCLGYHNPFYLEVKNDISEEDMQEQNAFAEGLSGTKKEVFAAAGEQNLVIIAYRCKQGLNITIDRSRVESVSGIEQKNWTFKVSTPFVF